jgi:hypothetical protein
MARDGGSKLVLRNNGAGPNEFYDLRSDPREKKNRFEDPARRTIRDRLRNELETWRARYSGA